jgi:hemerythrin
MDRFRLTNDLLTGMDDIDAQHRMVIDLANRIVDQAAERGADAEFFDSLRFLSEYVQYHFAAEELAMQQTDFADYEQHCGQHRAFRERIGELIEISLEAESIAPLRDRVFVVVVGWLTRHVQMADKKLAKHLRSHAADMVARLPDTASLASSGMLDGRIDLERIDAGTQSAPDP